MRARACVVRSVLCAWMGRTFVSWWRMSVCVIRVQPVAVLRAAFCMTWIFFMLVLDVEGDQIGVA